MPVKDELGTRMKEFYEEVPKTRLVRRMPVAIRIDGKAFHTFTRGFQKPFDEILVKSMQDTMKYLCENIQGCVLGYTQSDEITLILVDYKHLNSDAWFDYEIQKMCSIAASMATMAFNKAFASNVAKQSKRLYKEYLEEKDASYIDTLEKAMNKGAMFDARCFNIPKEEVCNLIYWRQLDATRNSIQMVGQANFSHRELQCKSCNEIQNMLLSEKEINWNNYPIPCKRGTACFKVPNLVRQGENVEVEFKWKLDELMPILKENWDYINRFVYVGE